MRPVASEGPAAARGGTFFDASLADLADPGLVGQAAGHAPPGPVAAAGQRASVLADRLAVVVSRHEPGWRLPRPTALARRYAADPDEISAATDQLVARHLVRQLPDGQLYRASPAEYHVPVAGVAGLGVSADPMGAELTCIRYRASWQRPPAEIGSALRIPPADQVCVLDLEWACDGQPAATSVTYLAAHLAAWYRRADLQAAWTRHGVWPLLPPRAASGELGRVPSAVCRASALTLEMQVPPPWLARRWRLRAGQLAFVVTARFDDSAVARPAAVTTATLHCELFRIALESADSP